MSVIVGVTGLSGVMYYLDRDGKAVWNRRQAKRCHGRAVPPSDSARALYDLHASRYKDVVKRHLTAHYIDPDGPEETVEKTA